MKASDFFKDDLATAWACAAMNAASAAIWAAHEQSVTGKAEPFMVARWNDDPERTQAEVVSALRNAAQQAEGEGK